VTAVSAADRRNIRSVARGGQPVVDGRSDGAAADRRLAWAVMAGDEQDHPVASGDRLLERAVDRAPRAIEAQSMKVDDPVRLDRTFAKAAIPGRVEGIPPRDGEGNRPRSGRWRGPTVEAPPRWGPTTSLRLAPLPVPGRIFVLTR